MREDCTYASPDEEYTGLRARYAPRRDAFVVWLQGKPKVDAAFRSGSHTFNFIDYNDGEVADAFAKSCRVMRKAVSCDPAAREQNLLRYVAFRKMSWFARGQPRPQW